MKILISGAAGFLGGCFLNHYIGRADLIAVDDFSSPYSTWPERAADNERTALITADLADWLHNDDDFDLAFHFAAPVGGREKIEGDPLFNADSLRLDSLFFRWATKHVKTAVYPSSSAVYPVSLQGDKAMALNEDYFSASHASWNSPDEMYGFTKLVGEKLAYTAAGYGLSTLCIRPFSGYGEGQSPEYPVTSIALRALRHEDPLAVWGPGTQKRDFIHASDIVAATVARLDARIEGYETMNIGSGFALDFNDIARLCSEITGYVPTIQNDESKPVGVQTRFADIRRMERYYGPPKVAIRDGLTRVIEWLRKTKSVTA